MNGRKCKSKEKAKGSFLIDFKVLFISCSKCCSFLMYFKNLKKKFLFCFAFFVVCLDLVFYFDLFCWVLFLCFVIFSRCYLFRKAKEINFKKLKYSV